MGHHLGVGGSCPLQIGFDWQDCQDKLASLDDQLQVSSVFVQPWCQIRWVLSQEVQTLPFSVSSLFRGPNLLASQSDLEFVQLTSLVVSSQLAFRLLWNGVQFEEIFVEDAAVAYPWADHQVHVVGRRRAREVKPCSWASALHQD